MATKPFRITPSLGPGLTSVGPNYWDGISFKPGAATTDPDSYQIGSKVVGSDGHDYLYVKAGGTIAAGAQVAISTDFVATTGGTSGYYVPSEITGGVKSGQAFHVRKGATV